VQGSWEQIANVEEVGAGHWWVLYNLMRAIWVVMGTLVVENESVLHIVPYFAEVLDVGIPVDRQQNVFLVVEENNEYWWWIVRWTY
jgi:hypothetical protein